MTCSNCKHEYEGNFCPQCGTPATQEKVSTSKDKYCTNCGAHIDGSICKKCGVRNNTTHKYCMYCGTPITDRATLCVSCHERVHGNTLVRVLAIISLCLTPIWFLFVALGTEDLICTLFVLPGTALMLLLAIPRGNIKIKHMTHRKKGLRFLVYFLCFFLSFLISVEGPIVWDALYNDRQTSQVGSGEANTEEGINSTAIRVAKAILQNELKNPSSLQIHNADVTLTGFDSDHNPIYVIELDYSAQNGFGGMNRDTYAITLVYKINECKFYYGNTKINID